VKWKLILILILIAFVIIFLGYYKFSIFPPNVIYQGQGQVPTNLQIDNQILDFDRGEKSFNWAFDMSGYYSAGCCAYYCSQQVEYYWVAKIDGNVVDKGEGVQQLSGCGGTSQNINWKVSGTVNLPDNMTIGRHYLEIIVATLPKRQWTISSAEVIGGCTYLSYYFPTLACSCTKYNSGSCAGYCNCSASQCMGGDCDVNYIEEACLLKKCGYNSCIQPLGKDKLFVDLANGYICKDAVDTVWDTCYNTYTNDCNKCGVNGTQDVLVFSSGPSSTGGRQNNCPGGQSCDTTNVLCPYDKCIVALDNCCPFTVTEYTVSKGGSLCTHDYKCSYSYYVKGYNTQTICNNCTLAEQCNPQPKIDTTKDNTYRGEFTVTDLTKDFVVCKGGQCVLQVQCTKDSDCPTPCQGVVCYCGTDNYCHCSGSCITRPEERSIWDEINRVWNQFWSWVLSKLGWL
jgi:hypothetical protein